MCADSVIIFYNRLYGNNKRFALNTLYCILSLHSTTRATALQIIALTDSILKCAISFIRFENNSPYSEFQNQKFYFFFRNNLYNELFFFFRKTSKIWTKLRNVLKYVLKFDAFDCSTDVKKRTLSYYITSQFSLAGKSNWINQKKASVGGDRTSFLSIFSSLPFSSRNKRYSYLRKAYPFLRSNNSYLMYIRFTQG